MARVGITDISAHGFWVSVSKTLGSTRTPKQCRSKWCVIGSTHLLLCYIDIHNSAGLMRSKPKSEGKARHAGVRWTTISWFASTCCVCVLLIVVPARHLVYRIASLNVDEETDIDWGSLNDPSWMWSRHSLQRRWRGLKASLVSDSMSHRGESMTFSTFIPLYIPDRCRT